MMNTKEAKFSFAEWIKLCAIVVPLLVSLAWAIIGLFMKVEYMQGRLYEQKGELMAIQNKEAEREVSLGVMNQQLLDISQRLGRMENKMDGVK